MHSFQCSSINGITASLSRSLWMLEDCGEKHVSYALVHVSFLLNRTHHLAFQCLIHSGQVFAQLPRIHIQRVLDRFSEGGLKLIAFYRQKVIFCTSVIRTMQTRANVWLII